MDNIKGSKKYQLIVYRQIMDRIWQILLFLGLVLSGLWYWFDVLMPVAPNLYENLAFYLGIGLVGLALIIILARNMAYIQMKPDFVNLVTPFIRIKISYRRIRSLTPTELSRVFQPKKITGIQRQTLQPYWGQTVLIMELNGYPLSPHILRWFINPLMINPHADGFVILVKDWMTLSKEFDTWHARWMKSQTQRSPSGYGIGRG
jgi:hypothetical protein